MMILWKKNGKTTWPCLVLQLALHLCAAVVTMVEAQDSSTTGSNVASFGSLECNGVNAIEEQNLNIRVDGSTFGASASAILVDTPAYTEAPLCFGDDTEDASTGFWYAIQDPTDAYYTFMACAMGVNDTAGVTFRLEISLYSDLVLQTDQQQRRDITGSCTEMTCLAEVDVQTSYDPALYEQDDFHASWNELRSSTCSGVGSSFQSVTFEGHPFYNYFLYVKFVGLDTPATLQYYSEGSTSSLNGPSNDYYPENLLLVQSTYGQVVQGTLTNATLDAVPLCEQQEPQPSDLGTRVGVWYQMEPTGSVQDGSFPVDACVQGSTVGPYVSVLKKDDMSCVTTTKACTATFTPEGIQTEYLVYVYAQSTEDANAIGDFALTLGEKTESSGGAFHLGMSSLRSGAVAVATLLLLVVL